MREILLLLVLQDARDVPSSGRPIELRVPVSTEDEHRATVVSFPEEALEALVAGWNEGDLSIERRRESLFVKLLRPVRGDLHVLGASGALYRLAIRPAEGAYDGHVRVRDRDRERRSAPEPVELVRAMRLGRLPAEGRVLRADGGVYASDEIAARLAFVYETDAYRGFVVRVENASAQARRLDPSRFAGRGLVLAGAREMLLAPGERTILYLVFGKAP